MERKYKDGTKKDITFFIGTEIEKTPAYGLKTLFVVGLQSIENVKEHLHADISHIFFGANHSFNPTTFEHLSEWTNMINNYNYSVLIFAYNPKSLQGINEVLFLVITKLDRENKELLIKNIIQSPFWDEEQISSINLKKSLIDQNDYTNMTSISFDYLYDDNQRFKLAWNTWLMEIEDI